MTDTAVVRPDLLDPFADRRILVLIASYRDPELASTVASALTQAAYPEHLRFAICHQFDESTRPLLRPWADDPRFVLDELPAEESKGCCWARARTFAAYDDEPYVLQIDAHTRFAARWDQRYIEMLEALPSEKAVLTTYPPPYHLRDDGSVDYNLEVGVQRLDLKRLNANLSTVQGTSPVAQLDHPEPSWLLAAGQVFTRGQFCVDVPYDEAFYFEGEEISLAVRAFSHGYDLYCPNENLIWHRYAHGERLHWEDHELDEPQREAPAERLHALLRGDASALGRVGLGTERTVAEFEELSGIDFSMHDINGPPVDWSRELVLDLDGIDFDLDYDCFVFSVLTDAEVELQREDIFDADILAGRTRSVSLSFEGIATEPTQYLLWPRLADGSFGERRIRSIDGSELPSEPQRASGSVGAVTVLEIDRSVIEPRDDYALFRIVLFDQDGREVETRDLRAPDLLDLSRGSVRLFDLDPAVRRYVVTPVRNDGHCGPGSLRTIRPDEQLS